MSKLKIEMILNSTLRQVPLLSGLEVEDLRSVGLGVSKVTICPVPLHAPQVSVPALTVRTIWPVPEQAEQI